MSIDEADPEEARVRLDMLRVAPGPPDVLGVRLTVPAKPFRLVRVIVEVPEEPAGIVIKFGLAEIPKFGAEFTVTRRIVECISPAAEPVTVTV